MATFTGNTRFLVALLVVVSMSCAVDFCHGARDTVSRRPDGYVPTVPSYPVVPMPVAPYCSRWRGYAGACRGRHPSDPPLRTLPHAYPKPQNGEIPQP
uniref:Uncharacterized protein n=1 Tax=Leersia perrieri TaxID=77586 RepID=A0A0D9WRN9_9ORYZ